MGAGNFFLPLASYFLSSCIVQAGRSIFFQKGIFWREMYEMYACGAEKQGNY